MIKPTIIATTSATVARQIRKDNEKNNYYQDTPGFEGESENPADEYLAQKKNNFKIAALSAAFALIASGIVLSSSTIGSDSYNLSNIHNRYICKIGSFEDVEIKLPKYDTIVDVKNFFGKTTIIVNPGEIPIDSPYYIITTSPELKEKFNDFSITLDTEIKYNFDDVLSQESVKGMSRSDVKSKVASIQAINRYIMMPSLDYNIDSTKNIEDINR